MEDFNLVYQQKCIRRRKNDKNSHHTSGGEVRTFLADEGFLFVARFIFPEALQHTWHYRNVHITLSPEHRLQQSPYTINVYGHQCMRAGYPKSESAPIHFAAIVWHGARAPRHFLRKLTGQRGFPAIEKAEFLDTMTQKIGAHWKRVAQLFQRLWIPR